MTDLPFTLPAPDPTRPERTPAKCGCCGWVWDRDGEPVSDEENKKALDERVLKMLAQFFADHPDQVYSLEEFRRRFPVPERLS